MADRCALTNMPEKEFKVELGNGYYFVSESFRDKGILERFDSFAPAHLAPAGLPMAVFRAVSLTAWVLCG